jgi:hypothetical protein
LSRKGAKSRTQGRKLRSTGTKAKARVTRKREPGGDLHRRELADAREQLFKALEQQRATAISNRYFRRC